VKTVKSDKSVSSGRGASNLPLSHVAAEEDLASSVPEVRNSLLFIAMSNETATKLEKKNSRTTLVSTWCPTSCAEVFIRPHSHRWQWP